MPVDMSLRIHINLVGDGSEVISALCVVVAVCDDPLSALLEVGQSITYLLQGCVIGGEDACFQIDALYLIFSLSLFDG